MFGRWALLLRYCLRLHSIILPVNCEEYSQFKGVAIRLFKNLLLFLLQKLTKYSHNHSFYVIFKTDGNNVDEDNMEKLQICRIR